MESLEPFEPKGDGEFWKIPYRYINAIVSEEDKHVRRKALSIIFTEISSIHEQWKNHLAKEKVAESGEGDSTAVTFYDEKNEEVIKLIKPLMKSITDPVERCRETAYDIMTLIISLLPESEFEPNLPFIIPPLVDRFGEPEITETSEEVRFTAMKFITALMEAVQRQQLLPYVDDLIQILSFLIVDPFHSVRIAACNACSYLAMKSKGVFHITSDKLLTPLCTSITHQQFRVRCAVIECLGDVILFGNHKSLVDVLPHITQRLFDPSPNVRKLAIAVSANWLMNYVDRYSYFQKLLPIILTGLSDESPENAQLALILWKNVGEQYLKENEDEYKDETNFPKPIDTTEGPYKTVERPTFGCRALVWRNIGNILPGVANDITDWVVTTRIKCAQILYQLILNAEDKIIMHTQIIIKALTYAINDENPIVVSNAKKAAELLGYFVPIDSCLPLLITSVTSTSSIGPLKVLLSIIIGGPSAGLYKEAFEIGNLISNDDICQTLNMERQKVIAEILLAMENKSPKSFCRKEESGKRFFRVGVTVLAMSKCPTVSKQALEFLDKMRELNGFNTVDELASEMCGDILKEIRSNSCQWTSVTPDKLIFEKILSFGVSVVECHTKLILTIMTENLGPERDPEVRLRFFALLAENLQHCPKSGCETQLHDFIKNIIEHVLTPNLVWVAGKTAGALRTAASSCILSILDADILPSNVILSIAPDLIPALLSLTDDNATLTRQIACKSIEKVIVSSNKKLSPDLVNKIYPVLLKRLDDVSNEIRLFACMCLHATFKNLPQDYEPTFYRYHLTGAMSTLMVHLDDDDEEIQDVIFNTLVVIAKVARVDAIEACQNFRLKHRTPAICDKLLNVIESGAQTNQ